MAKADLKSLELERNLERLAVATAKTGQAYLTYYPMDDAVYIGGTIKREIYETFGQKLGASGLKLDSPAFFEAGWTPDEMSVDFAIPYQGNARNQIVSELAEVLRATLQAHGKEASSTLDKFSREDFSPIEGEPDVRSLKHKRLPRDLSVGI